MGVSRNLVLRDRSRRKGPYRRLARRVRRPSTRSIHYALDTRNVDGRPRLYVPTLLRFFRLQRDGGRTGLRVRTPDSAEFQLAVQGDGSVGLLEAMAHLPLDRPARLPLY